jgi:hypothetical protein
VVVVVVGVIYASKTVEEGVLEGQSGGCGEVDMQRAQAGDIYPCTPKGH